MPLAPIPLQLSLQLFFDFLTFFAEVHFFEKGVSTKMVKVRRGAGGRPPGHQKWERNASDIATGCPVVVVGDGNQSIYSFKDQINKYGCGWRAYKNNICMTRSGLCTTFSSLCARALNSVTVCKQGVTVSAKYHTQNHNERMPRSITTLKLEVFYPWISNTEVFITIIYSLLLMACFSSTLDSSLLDLCCFSLHLCGLSSIYISSLG